MVGSPAIRQPPAHGLPADAVLAGEGADIEFCRNKRFPSGRRDREFYDILPIGHETGSLSFVVKARRGVASASPGRPKMASRSENGNRAKETKPDKSSKSF
jgi:hypothetical protein